MKSKESVTPVKHIVRCKTPVEDMIKAFILSQLKSNLALLKESNNSLFHITVENIKKLEDNV